MKTYNILELIELKNSGRKFNFHRGACSLPSSSLFKDSKWSMDQILSDWTVEFEPEVVEFELSVTEIGVAKWSDARFSEKLKGKRWKVVMTEIVEGE